MTKFFLLFWPSLAFSLSFLLNFLPFFSLALKLSLSFLFVTAHLGVCFLSPLSQNSLSPFCQNSLSFPWPSLFFSFPFVETIYFPNRSLSLSMAIVLSPPKHHSFVLFRLGLSLSPSSFCLSSLNSNLFSFISYICCNYPSSNWSFTLFIQS